MKWNYFTCCAIAFQHKLNQHLPSDYRCDFTDGRLEPKRQSGKAKEMEEINKKVKEKEIILIGDSITKNMERFASNYYEYFPASTVLNAGITGETVKAILYRVKEMHFPCTVQHTNFFFVVRTICIPTPLQLFHQPLLKFYFPFTQSVHLLLFMYLLF